MSSVISHIHEVSAGIDCGGEKKKHPWSVHGCFSPRFVYQNALHRMIGHVALHPSELMGFFPSARQCHPDAKSDLRFYGRASLILAVLVLPLALSHRAVSLVWNGQSQKVGHGDHLLEIASEG